MTEDPLIDPNLDRMTPAGENDALDNALDAHTFGILREIADIKTYPPGTPLTHQGQTERTFYVVENGTVVVSRRMEDGQEPTADCHLHAHCLISKVCLRKDGTCGTIVNE